MRVRVTAPSRLHFGLLRLPEPAETGRRAFGGAGLMIAEPGIRLRVEPAESWTAHGPLAQRALAFARTFVSNAPETQRSRAFAIIVDEAPAEHIGLGTGTQLGMAVAKGLATALELNFPALELARRVGRGARSGLGIHGFAQGGFLVDGGKGPHTQIAPIIARLPFPDEWRVLLVMPRDRCGVHGSAEQQAFAKCTASADRETDALCRLVLLGMLPALAEHDLSAFGAALHEFNRRVGEMFRPWQGGVYAHPGSADLVEHLRTRGVEAVGQSSWGPTVFAIAETDQATRLASDLQRTSSDQILLTTASNTGATISCQP